MLYVYAATAGKADAWARAQGARPRDFRAAGDRCRCVDGVQFTVGDRIVVVGNVSPKLLALLIRNRLKARDAPPIEYR